jgi:hypothetical protein
MNDRTPTALEAMRSIRKSAGFARLDVDERRMLERDLRRVEDALRPTDPYASALDDPAARSPSPGVAAPASGATTPSPAPAAPPPGTAEIGERGRRALDAVDFSGFVAGLVTGTFRSIVDATAQQVREYAGLVASISKTVDEFSRDNVTPNQVRDWLSNRYPRDLKVVLPEAGKQGESPRLVPAPDRGADSPAWLATYGLDGQAFNEELTEGPLIDAGRRSLGEERLQSLATMVLLGINRIVVNDGQIRARLVFHASARETLSAEIQQGSQQQGGIAARTIGPQSAISTMVSTVSVNAQADASVKVDLTGEVSIQFRTESFPLERFADSGAMQLINQHARWQSPAAAPVAQVAAPASPNAAGSGGGKPS